MLPCAPNAEGDGKCSERAEQKPGLHGSGPLCTPAALAVGDPRGYKP